MTKEVSIIIEGTQIGIEEEPILITAAGTYHMHNDKHYIQYEELSEDGLGHSKNLIKIGATKIEMTKKGASNSEMSFDLKHITPVIYQTPYGSLCFQAQTAQFTVEETNHTLKVTMEYSLYSNEEHISDNRTIIRIQSSQS